jgi:hypothetical protein
MKTENIRGKKSQTDLSKTKTTSTVHDIKKVTSEKKSQSSNKAVYLPDEWDNWVPSEY